MMDYAKQIKEALRELMDHAYSDGTEGKDCPSSATKECLARVTELYAATVSTEPVLQQIADFGQLQTALERISELETQLAALAAGAKISIPTITMEQEFSNHRRLGYNKAKDESSQRIANLERQLADTKVKTEVTVGVGSGDGQLFVHGDYESVKAVQAKLLELESLRRQLAERGEPCYHKGCLSHVTHPCEGCGRVAGRSPQNEGTNHD